MKKAEKEVRGRPLYLSILVIASLAIAASILLVHIYSRRTIQNRVYEEMGMLAATQAEIIDRENGEQFTPLYMLAEYIKSASDFQEESGRQVLEALTKENHFCALGFADRNGDAVTYDAAFANTTYTPDGISIKAVKTVNVENGVVTGQTPAVGAVNFNNIYAEPEPEVTVTAA